MPGKSDIEPLASREFQFAERVNQLGFNPPARPEDFVELFGLVEQAGLTGDPCGPNREQFEIALAMKKFPACLIRLAGFILDQALLPPAWR